jgi:microcystin-dependent protein
MAQPFIGEIRMFAGNFAPSGWMLCNGQLLSIPENETLFQLIGTTYGGDGQMTFALPDLRGRLPVHQGSGYTLASQGGQETVVLTSSQVAQHTHQLKASTVAATASNPTGLLPGKTAGTDRLYLAQQPSVQMANAALAATGGSKAHENLQPFLCVNYIISLFGIFPSPS